MTFGQLNPAYFLEAVLEADRLGFESAWLPEHLVFPVEMHGQLVPGEEHPPVPPSTPVYDACAFLSWIAAQTTHIRLGTFVYLLGLRHPFVGARASYRIALTKVIRVVPTLGVAHVRVLKTDIDDVSVKERSPLSPTGGLELAAQFGHFVAGCDFQIMRVPVTIEAFGGFGSRSREDTRYLMPVAAFVGATF